MNYFEKRTDNIIKLWNVGLTGAPRGPLTGGEIIIPMDELHFVFIIYALGVMAGSVAFVAELLWRRWQMPDVTVM